MDERNTPDDIISPLQQRINEASAKYDGPGSVDISAVWVGDRPGILITMNHVADLTVTVSCPLIESDITFASIGIGYRSKVHGEHMRLPEEIGVTCNRNRSGTFSRNQV